MMKISIGADHRGFSLKQKIIEHFSLCTFLDVGAHDAQRSDYPVFAQKVCSNILSEQACLGILLCGSGVGMAIAANRFPGIYAALCWSSEIARLSREDDGSNVLVVPADFVTAEQTFDMIQTWLNAQFKAGIYQKRLDMIDS